MAPPTPVYKREEILSQNKNLLADSNCKLKSLIQNECTFHPNGEIICLPFKRLFKSCLTNNNVHQLIEVTNEKSNNPVHDFKNDAEVFLDAEKELRKLLEYELSKSD